MAFGFSKKHKGLLRAGEDVPAVRLKEIGGGERSLAQLAAEGGTLLAFFKVSCPVCQFTLPFLERLAAGGAMRVFGVSQDDAKATGRFAQQYGLTFPMLLDQAAAGYAASNAFGISSVPSLFLVDGKGTVACASEGFVKSDLLDLGRRAGVEVFRQDEYVPEWKAG